MLVATSSIFITGPPTLPMGSLTCQDRHKAHWSLTQLPSSTESFQLQICSTMHHPAHPVSLLEIPRCCLRKPALSPVQSVLSSPYSSSSMPLGLSHDALASLSTELCLLYSFHLLYDTGKGQGAIQCTDPWAHWPLETPQLTRTQRLSHSFRKPESHLKLIPKHRPWRYGMTIRKYV